MAYREMLFYKKALSRRDKIWNEVTRKELGQLRDYIHTQNQENKADVVRARNKDGGNRLPAVLYG